MYKKKLGFKNYHDMSLTLSDQNPADIDALFDELDELTKPTFIELKKEMDEYFAARYKIPAAQLMPWHYQNRFFQEAPKIYNIDLDTYYAKVDIAKVCKDSTNSANSPSALTSIALISLLLICASKNAIF